MHEFAVQKLGVSVEEFYATPEILTAATLQVQLKFGIDVPVLDYDAYSIEKEIKWFMKIPISGPPKK